MIYNIYVNVILLFTVDCVSCVSAEGDFASFCEHRPIRIRGKIQLQSLQTCEKTFFVLPS